MTFSPRVDKFRLPGALRAAVLVLTVFLLVSAHLVEGGAGPGDNSDLPLPADGEPAPPEGKGDQFKPPEGERDEPGKADDLPPPEPSPAEKTPPSAPGIPSVPE